MYFPIFTLLDRIIIKWNKERSRREHRHSGWWLVSTLSHLQHPPSSAVGTTLKEHNSPSIGFRCHPTPLANYFLAKENKDDTRVFVPGLLDKSQRTQQIVPLQICTTTTHPRNDEYILKANYIIDKFGGEMFLRGRSISVSMNANEKV